MRVAMASSVPSPPRTTTRSTACGQFLAGHRAAPCGGRSRERRRVGLEDRLDAALAQPGGELRQVVRGREPALGDDADRCGCARSWTEVEEELDVALLARNGRRG